MSARPARQEDYDDQYELESAEYPLPRTNPYRTGYVRANREAAPRLNVATGQIYRAPQGSPANHQWQRYPGEVNPGFSQPFANPRPPMPTLPKGGMLMGQGNDFAPAQQPNYYAQPQRTSLVESIFVFVENSRWVVPAVILAMGGLVLFGGISFFNNWQESNKTYAFVGTGLIATNSQELRSVAPGGTHAVEGKPSISVAKIQEVLRGYNSPAFGSAQNMFDLGVKYNIDPAYALAFFIHESTAGTKGIAVNTKSIGNIRYTSNSGFENYQGFRKYPTWEAGIEDWYRLIKTLYIDSWGLKTVDQIIPRYAPSSDGNNPPAYINGVKNSVDSWRKS